MKETYEELKMEVIAFDGEIWTATDGTAGGDIILTSNADPTPA